jgi:hypothetical protein
MRIGPKMRFSNAHTPLTSIKRNLFSTVSATGLLLTAFGCNETVTVSPKGCAQNVEVAVANETTPVFSWAPACGVSSLSVETIPSNTGTVETIWAFSVPETNLVLPGIRYGRAPSEASVSVAPRPLVAGTNYRVRVLRISSVGLIIFGEAIFSR